MIKVNLINISIFLILYYDYIYNTQNIVSLHLWYNYYCINKSMIQLILYQYIYDTRNMYHVINYLKLSCDKTNIVLEEKFLLSILKRRNNEMKTSF